MVSFIENFLEDKDYVISNYGKKQYYIICTKIIFSLFINPLLLLFFFFLKWYGMFFLWTIVTVYWIVKVFYGKKISEKIYSWQQKQIMKNFNK